MLISILPNIQCVSIFSLICIYIFPFWNVTIFVLKLCNHLLLYNTLPGIGKFIALDFARRGARVILACRSESRGSAAVKEIREKTGNSDVHLRLVDLSSLDSVRKFAKGILEEEKTLHILVNNAAVSGDPCGHTRIVPSCTRKTVPQIWTVNS